MKARHPSTYWPFGCYKQRTPVAVNTRDLHSETGLTASYDNPGGRKIEYYYLAGIQIAATK